MNRLQVAILYIVTVEGPITAKELREDLQQAVEGRRFKINARTLRRQLKLLVDSGQLEMMGAGTHFEYRLPQESIKKLPNFSKDAIVKRMRQAHRKFKHLFCINGRACKEKRL